MSKFLIRRRGVSNSGPYQPPPAVVMPYEADAFFHVDGDKLNNAADISNEKGVVSHSGVDVVQYSNDLLRKVMRFNHPHDVIEFKRGANYTTAIVLRLPKFTSSNLNLMFSDTVDYPYAYIDGNFFATARWASLDPEAYFNGKNIDLTLTSTVYDKWLVIVSKVVNDKHITRVGGFDRQYIRPFNADVAEIAIWERATDYNFRKQVGDFLMEKWDLK